MFQTETDKGQGSQIYSVSGDNSIRRLLQCKYTKLNARHTGNTAKEQMHSQYFH